MDRGENILRATQFSRPSRRCNFPINESQNPRPPFLGLSERDAFPSTRPQKSMGTRLYARPEITVVVRNLRQLDGGRNRSSTFSVEYAGEKTPDLTCGNNSSALSENETVFVQYLQFDTLGLYMKVLYRRLGESAMLPFSTAHRAPLRSTWGVRLCSRSGIAGTRPSADMTRRSRRHH